LTRKWFADQPRETFAFLKRSITITPPARASPIGPVKNVLKSKEPGIPAARTCEEEPVEGGVNVDAPPIPGKSD
jgi:hypothetical protein